MSSPFGSPSRRTTRRGAQRLGFISNEVRSGLSNDLECLPDTADAESLEPVNEPCCDAIASSIGVLEQLHDVGVDLTEPSQQQLEELLPAGWRRGLREDAFHFLVACRLSSVTFEGRGYPVAREPLVGVWFVPCPLEQGLPARGLPLCSLEMRLFCFAFGFGVTSRTHLVRRL